jgi:CBS-domain-containing membrane protein
VQQILKKMHQHDAGYIMIGRDRVLEGIVSKSDISGAVSPYLRSIFAKWRRFLDDATLKIKTKWIMNRPVRTIRPETSMLTLMDIMCRFGGRALPVMDEQGKVQGLVTVFDIFRVLLDAGADCSIAGRTAQGPPLL